MAVSTFRYSCRVVNAMPNESLRTVSTTAHLVYRKCEAKTHGLAGGVTKTEEIERGEGSPMMTHVLVNSDGTLSIGHLSIISSHFGFTMRNTP